jgi:hypothetical protein
LRRHKLVLVSKCVALATFKCPVTNYSRERWCSKLMIEGLAHFNAERVYEELKRLLLANECKIVSEDPPRSITVEHGSLWAWSTRDIKKRVKFVLIPQDSKTKIVAFTSLAPSYIALSVIAFTLLAIILLIEALALINAEAWLRSWSWLINLFFGSAITQSMQEQLNTLKAFLIVSLIVLVIAAVSEIYTYSRRETFAEEIIRALS